MNERKKQNKIRKTYEINWMKIVLKAKIWITLFFLEKLIYKPKALKKKKTERRGNEMLYV